MIFDGSEARPSKTVYKKLERELLTADPTTQRVEWWQQAIMFGPENHPKSKLSNRNLLFVVKIPIY